MDDRTGEDDERPPARPARRRLPWWQEVPLLLVVAFGLAVLIRALLLQAFHIPSGSMEDTLRIGDRVLVNKVVYETRDPRRGEVVVFRGTAGWTPQYGPEPDPGLLGGIGRTLADLVGMGRPGEKDFIKRVVGVPGDRVMCCDDQGRVTVNGVPLDETYVLQDSPLDLPPDGRECRSRRFSEVVVPPGHLFVMGDHRMVSQDSRCQGTIPIDNVIGRAFMIVWPYSRWATLPVPETFDDLSETVAAPSPEHPAHPAADRGQPAESQVMLVTPIVASGLFAARARRRCCARRRTLQW